ncbi:MFS transporter [Streptomonospora sediminis]
MATSAGSGSYRLTKTQRSAFISAFIGWLFDYYEVFLLTFLLIPISREFGLSAGQGAALVSVSLAFMAVGGVVFGVAADRWGRRRILILTILLFTLATFARGIAPNYPVLLVLTAVAGLGLGGEYGVGQSLVAEVLDRHRRGWWSGLFYGAAFWSIMAAAVVGGYLLPLIGWRWTFVVSGLPVLVAFWLRRHTPESAAWQKTSQRSRNRPAAYGRRSFLVPFAKCFVAATLYFWAYYGVATLLPQYLVDNGFSMANASWWVFFTAFAGFVGCVAGSWATDRFGRRPTLFGLMVLAAAGGFAVYLLGTEMLLSVWILVPFFVMYFGSNGPTVFGSLFSEMFPTETRSTGVSTAIQFARGTSSLPPILAAAIIPATGFTTVFLIATGIYLLAGLWAWVFPETRGMDVDSIDGDKHESATGDGPADRSPATATGRPEPPGER